MQADAAYAQIDAEFRHLRSTDYADWLKRQNTLRTMHRVSADLVRAFHRSDEEIKREITEDVIVRTLWMEPEPLTIAVEQGEVEIVLLGLAAAHVQRHPAQGLSLAVARAVDDSHQRKLAHADGSTQCDQGRSAITDKR